MLLVSNSWQEVSVLFTVCISLVFSLLFCQLLCRAITWPFPKHWGCCALLFCFYISNYEVKLDTKKAVWEQPERIQGLKKSYWKKMIMARLGGMWSSLPTAPYDYCQDHESSPNNVVVNAVIPTCNAGYLLLMQPGFWKTYCISKDSQEWIISTKIAVKLC